MTDTVFGSQDPSTTANSYNTLVFVVKQILAQVQTVSLVKIVACSADGAVAAPGTVNMQVLANLMTGNRTPVPHGILANRPYFRLRGGSNAVIMDPAPGDIGIAVFCSRDSSAVIQAQGAANPGSFRTFDWADGIYIGGLLGEAPLQYLQFNSSGVTLVSPTALTLQAPTVAINGATTVEGTQTVTGAAVFDTTVGVTGGLTAASADVTGDMSVGGSLTVSGGIIGSVAVDSADSVTGTGLPAAPLKLVGDTASPGDTYYYGTNASGTKGFYPLAESGGTVTSVGITSTGGTIAVTGTNPVTSSGDINIDLEPTGVTAGTYSYPTLHVNAEGQITTISSNTPSSGTVTSVGISTSTLILGGTNPVVSSGTISVNLASGIITPGSFTNANITVDTYGRVTAAASGSGSSLEITDGTNTVTSATELILSGAPVSVSGTIATAYVNITPDTHPISPTAWDDEFEYGSAIDTSGARRSGANAWTVYNVQSTSNLVAGGALRISAVTGGDDDATVYGQSLTGVGSTWTFALKKLTSDTASFSGFFVGFSSTGLGYYYGYFYNSGSPLIEVVTQSTFAGSGASRVASVAGPLNSAVYLSVGYNGTDIIFSYSYDGVIWITLYSVTPATFLGGNPNTIGLMIGGSSVASGYSASVGYDWFRRTA